MKHIAWFIAGMMMGEFVLRWIIHAAYISVILMLGCTLYLR